jgi:membrane-bound lytic murein transglycosylase D
MGCCFCCFSTLTATSFADLSPEAKATHIMATSDSLVRARLSQLDTALMEHRLDDVVKRRIISYLEHWPRTSRRLLARALRYFPVFEEQLKAVGMPLSLRYVTVQESALRPYATSRAGAGGLWQLMPGTAREHGLIVNEVLDERLDAELGCAAGLEYLKLQYERYGDWALALAAYNCGPGNVNRALRRSRSTDFWKIRRYLPRETRNYVPNIIAAAYLMTFFHEHDIQAEAMELDLQITEAITVYRKISLHRVAQITGLRPEVVIELNPQYLRGYLPGLRGGHRLRLPSRVMPAMQEYLRTFPADQPESSFHLPWASPLLDQGELNGDRFYNQYSTVTGRADTSLQQIAMIYQIPVDQLAIWSNRGITDTLVEYDQLFFFRVEEYLPLDPRKRDTPPPAPVLADQPPVPISIPNRGYSKEFLQLQITVPPARARLKKTGVIGRVLSWFQ